MEHLDHFFPDITTHQSREILLEDPIPFAFLIRQVKREYVVTFLDNNLEFRDEKIPTRTDSFLRQHHHELQSPQDTSSSTLGVLPVNGFTQCPGLIEPMEI